MGPFIFHFYLSMNKYLVPPLFLLFAVFVWGCDKASGPQPEQTQRLFVVLGSSTAAGTGAGTYDSSWVGRTNAYLRAAQLKNSMPPMHQSDTLINLAVPGFASPDVLPAGNSAHNITKALSYHPYGIIINLPSNDIAEGISEDTEMQNFATVAALANQQNVEVWVTTSQPRNLNDAGRQKLIELRDKIIATYGPRSIDFWTGLANPDGTINPRYSAGDGIHLNHTGHRILFHRILEKGIFQN